MTHTVQLELPEHLYNAVVEAAGADGTTEEEWIVNSAASRLSQVTELPKPTANGNQPSDDPFRDAFGAFRSGNSRSGDNDPIDADLAREYGGMPDEE